MISRRAIVAVAAAGALSRPAVAQSGLAALSDLARRAAIYAIPIYQTYHRRWRETVDPANPRLMKLNQLDHAATSAPDTLLSAAWIDLTSEPMFLTVPDMGARSYAFAVVDMLGDTIDHVSRRHYGARSPPHVMFGPSWSNPPPTGVRAIHATTNVVRLTGSVAVEGADDLAAARTAQAKVLLETPAARNERRVLEAREIMPSRSVAPDELVAGWPEARPEDPWDLFVVAARVLGESPMPRRDAMLLAELTTMRLRAGRRFDLLGFSAMERAAMLDGIETARAEVLDAAAVRRVGAWRYPPRHSGDFGEDRLQRAVVAMTDLFMPETAESVTLVADVEEDGAPLDGKHAYALRWTANGPPPNRAFWSLAVDGQLIGGLRRGTGDRAEIPLRPVRRGAFAITLHICQPDAEVLDGMWRPPIILRIR